jgi:hypothetical protein
LLLERAFWNLGFSAARAPSCKKKAYAYNDQEREHHDGHEPRRVSGHVDERFDHKSTQEYSRYRACDSRKEKSLSENPRLHGYSRKFDGGPMLSLNLQNMAISLP